MSERRAQTEQTGGEKRETIIHHENQAHLRSPLRTNTRVLCRAVANRVRDGNDSRGPVGTPQIFQ